MRINYFGHILDVTYKYNKPYKGLRDSLNNVKGLGAQLEPDEPESVEIEQVLMGLHKLSYSETLWNQLSEIVLQELKKEQDYD